MHKMARLLVVLAVVVFAWNVPALAATSQEQKKDSDPTKGSKDVNEVVSYPMDKVLAAAKQAVDGYGCDVKREKADYLECTRSRHVGVWVGSGGEKVTVKLTTEGEGTRVIIETGKGFVGRAGKKNWSTPIFNKMSEILKSES